MEEEIKLGKQCGTDRGGKKGKYYCKTHKKVYGMSHIQAAHSAGDTIKNFKAEEIDSYMAVVRKGFEMILLKVNAYKLQNEISGLREELISASDQFNKLENRVQIAIRYESLIDYFELYSELKSFQKYLTTSEIMREVSMQAIILSAVNENPEDNIQDIIATKEFKNAVIAEKQKTEDFIDKKYSLKFKALNNEMVKIKEKVEQKDNELLLHKITKKLTSSSDEYNINMKEDYLVVKLLVEKKLILPNEISLYMRMVEDNNDVLKSFLDIGVPQELTLLNFSGGEQISSISFCIEELKQLCSKSGDDITILNFELNTNEFCDVIRASKDGITVSFVNCKIDPTGDMDLNVNGTYGIQTLEFVNLSYSDTSENWECNPEKFEHIMKAISLCELKDSLGKILLMGEKCIDQNKLKEFKQKYRMDTGGLKIE